MKKYSLTLTVLMIAGIVFGLAENDSLWIHINSVSEKTEAKKFNSVYSSWELYKREFSDSVYSEWKMLDVLDTVKIKYEAVCSYDSLFTVVADCGTTDANSYVFSGIEKEKQYYIHAKPINTGFAYKFDYAAGGITEAQDSSAFSKDSKNSWNIALSTGIALVIFGMIPIVVYALRDKKQRQCM